MASNKDVKLLQLSSFSNKNSFFENTYTKYIMPSQASLQSFLV